MAILKKKPLKKTLSRFQKKAELDQEDPQEQYWNTVNEEARSLITDALTQALPFPNLKNLDLEQDSDWNNLFAEYEINYSKEYDEEAEETNLPNSKELAQEIAYEYLFVVIRSLVRSLSQFDCYQPDHFEELTE